MVLGKTEYSNAVNARYTFQLLMSFWYNLKLAFEPKVSHFKTGKGLPYYVKLTLVLIKVLEINATLINPKGGKNYYVPVREINAKEVVKFQNERS